jgi:hypothetical protein
MERAAIEVACSFLEDGASSSSSDFVTATVSYEGIQGSDQANETGSALTGQIVGLMSPTLHIIFQ